MIGRYMGSEWPRLCRATRLAGCLLLALAMVACDEQGSSEGGSSEGGSSSAQHSDPGGDDAHKQSQPYTLRPNVYELDDQEVSQIVLDAGRIVVDQGADARLTERGVGDVLIADVGDGFWRYIERVESHAGKIIYQTRPAEMTEVIEQGELLLFVPAGGQAARASQQGYRTRHQELLDGLVEAGQEALEDGITLGPHVKSFPITKDLSEGTQGSFAGQNLEVSTAGEVEFEPGFKIYIKLTTNGVEEFEVSVFGNLKLDPRWELLINNGQPSSQVQTDSIVREIPLCSGDAAGFECRNGRPTLEFSIAGLTFRLYPQLDVGASWEGGGSGHLKGGFLGEGYVDATYRYVDGQSEFTEEIDFDTSAVDPEYDGQVALSVRSQARLSFVTERGDDKVLELVPFRGSFEMDADFEPDAICQFSSKLEMSGHFRSYGFPSSTSRSLYELTGFDTQHDLSDLPGCQTDNVNSQTGCDSDSGCEQGQVCSEAQYCVKDTPMRASLQWTEGDVDLDLVVRERDGTLFGTNPAAADGSGSTSTDGWRSIASAGGSGSGTFGEVVVFDRPRQGKEYFLSVNVNGSDITDGEPVEYTLWLTDKDRAADMITGTITPDAGNESVKFRYVPYDAADD